MKTLRNKIRNSEWVTKHHLENCDLERQRKIIEATNLISFTQRRHKPKQTNKATKGEELEKEI